MEIAIIGVGRLGGAMALALSASGHEIRQLVSRRNENSTRIGELITPKPESLSVNELDKISAELIFITTPDADIINVAELLAGKLGYKPFVFHTSGALSSEILHSLSEIGCPVASLHPLVSISDSQTGAKRFKNAFFCIEGAAKAVEQAENIVADLEGKSFSISTEFKSLYHASAVMASGHLVALFSAAIESLATCGLTESAAQEILLPLVKSTVENLATQTPARALTGTFARADVETLKSHLENLSEKVLPEITEIYINLGLRSLKLAQQQGADGEKLKDMKEILIDYKKEFF